MKTREKEEEHLVSILLSLILNRRIFYKGFTWRAQKGRIFFPALLQEVQWLSNECAVLCIASCGFEPWEGQWLSNMKLHKA